jgi:hypothetical protein
MENVLDVYKRAYNPDFPVVNMDESSKQLTKETRTPLPSRPGSVEKYDTEYERNGTCSIFLFTEALAGKRHVSIRKRRTAVDWAEEIKELVDVRYPDAHKILLVMDNLNTHAGSSLYKAFPPKEARRILKKLEFHYTPKHGSWLNIAEIELSVLSRQCLNCRIPDQETFIREVKKWEENRNNSAKKINWQFTTEDARIKLKRLYPTY